MTWMLTGHLELLTARDSDNRMHWKVHTRVISSGDAEAPIQSDPGTERCTDLRFKDSLRYENDKKMKMLVSHEVCHSLLLLFVRVLVVEQADAGLGDILAEQRFPSITGITCLGEDAFVHGSTNGNTSLSIAPVRAFPKLVFLKLYGIRMGVEARKGDDATVGFLKWLRTRKEAGVSVERLVFDRCDPGDA